MSGRGPVDPATRTLLHELFPGRLAPSERWGLGKTRALMAALGHPEQSFVSIHIGGTNGKGSVAAITAAVLRAAGHRVGLYTSPHLVQFNERIQVDGRPVEDTVLRAGGERLRQAVEDVDPAFFEAATALAFSVFQEVEVEIAVVEVGLGGRLDATNVIDPMVVGITNVGLDHREYLGETRESIAREKAGIAKPGVPFLTTEPPGPVRDVLLERAEALGAVTHAIDAAEVTAVPHPGGGVVDAHIDQSRWGPLDLPLRLAGAHQRSNLLLAVRLLEALPEPWAPSPAAMRTGVARTRWPGRLDRRKVGPSEWVFDVAHNADGVETLVTALPTLGLEFPVVALVGILGDKDWPNMLARLAASVDEIVLTQPPSAPPGRRWDLDEAMDWIRRRGWEGRVRCVADFGSALRDLAARGGTTLVTGSAHTVGDAFALLGIEPWPGES